MYLTSRRKEVSDQSKHSESSKASNRKTQAGWRKGSCKAAPVLGDMRFFYFILFTITEFGRFAKGLSGCLASHSASPTQLLLLLTPISASQMSDRPEDS